MIRSMTGFARVRSSSPKGGLAIEIRSLNHRYFELTLKLPPFLYDLEDRVRGVCHGRIRRGKVNVSVSEAEASSLADVTLNEDALRFYLAAIRKLKRQVRLRDDLSVRDLLSLPQIFTVEKKGEAAERFWPSLRGLLEKALGKHEASRIREGKILARDLSGRIGKIEGQLAGIERRAGTLPQEFYEKLKRRIEELFKDSAADPERISREAAFLAERSDITEELTRLKSHLRFFREKLKGNREVGKELDFVLQEMNRETNTLGAKAQDFGISEAVVSIKAELEKLREQVQNIE